MLQCLRYTSNMPFLFLWVLLFRSLYKAVSLLSVLWFFLPFISSDPFSYKSSLKSVVIHRQPSFVRAVLVGILLLTLFSSDVTNRFQMSFTRICYHKVNLLWILYCEGSLSHFAILPFSFKEDPSLFVVILLVFCHLQYRQCHGRTGQVSFLFFYLGNLLY